MTEEQKSEFKKHGCACCCLMSVANAAGNPITKAQFIDKFSQYPRFAFWKSRKMCGATNTGLVIDIIRELNLGESIQIFVNPDEVRKRIVKHETSAILFFTEKKDEVGGATSDYFHCRLLGFAIRADGALSAIDINDDLKVVQETQITDADIDRLKGYFLLIS